MRTFLHVGYPKAASTWLKQQFLCKVSNINLYDSSDVRRHFLEPGAFDFNVPQVKKHFRKDSQNDTWLSQELLTDKVKSGGIKHFLTKEMADRLKLVFPDAHIVLFIRNQIDILASSYLQYVKGGGNYSIRKFLFPERYAGLHTNRIALLGLDFFQYHKTIEYYQKLFGKEQVSVFLFEELAENPREFIKKFSVEFDLQYHESEIDFSSQNEAYRRFLIQSRRFTSTFHRDGPLNKYYILHLPKVNLYSRKFHQWANQFYVFGKRPKSTQIIGKHNTGIIKEYYKASNQILLNAHGLEEIKKFQYPL